MEVSVACTQIYLSSDGYERLVAVIIGCSRLFVCNAVNKSCRILSLMVRTEFNFSESIKREKIYSISEVFENKIDVEPSMGFLLKLKDLQTLKAGIAEKVLQQSIYRKFAIMKRASCGVDNVGGENRDVGAENAGVDNV